MITRTGTVVIQTDETQGNIANAVSVTQSGLSYLRVFGKNITISWRENRFEVNVRSNPIWRVKSISGSFITAYKAGTETLVVSCPENIGNQQRSGSVEVTNDVETVAISVMQDIQSNELIEKLPIP